MCGFHTISDVVFADACLCTNMREGEGEGGGGRDREIKRERERDYAWCINQSTQQYCFFVIFSEAVVICRVFWRWRAYLIRVNFLAMENGIGALIAL